LIVLLVVALGAVSIVPAAHAAFGIEEWEALTCNANEDSPAAPGAFPLAENPNQCNKTTSAKWFTQAAGHPNFGITEFVVENAAGAPEGFVRKIVVDTPEGLSVNPQAAPQCSLAQAEANILACPALSIVGTNYLTVVVAAGPTLARVAAPVYNVEPFQGAPSMVAFPDGSGKAVYIVGSLGPVDQHVRFTIDPVHAPEPPFHPPIVGSRLVFNGRAGNGTYLTMPSNCAGGQITTLFLESYPPVETDEEEFETEVGASGCGSVPFKPTIDVAPQGGAVDSPESETVTVGIPFDANAPIANSYLKTAKVVLPEGMGLNPASANGLVACTDAQFAKGTNDPIACPDASKIGTVEVQTPSLPADSLTGTVYVGQPLNNDSTTGEQFRIFIHAGSTRYGVNVRLVGKVFPDPNTGQLTAIVDENPQATFSSFKLRLNGGARGTLTSPPVCGPHLTNTEMTPWSENADENTPSSSFTLTSDPGGGACPASLGARRFLPVYTDRSDSTAANAFSPFHVHIGRADGEQELKVVNVTLPKGLSAKIAGVPYCPDSALTAAATKSGAAELASPSCPSASEIGTTTTSAGSGSGPIRIKGTAYLAGPYKGAPLSLATVTPAVAGPYDVGTVVVRIALNVNPETTQINAVSDVIPHLLDGVKLDIRAIDVDVNRSGFMHNPTNCDAKSIDGAIQGGGSNPADPAAFSSYPVSSPYLTTECDKLGFKPKLSVKLLGGRRAAKRRQHPGIQAVLTTREGDANVARTALTLPSTMLLDNAHIKTICTRVQLAAQQCPAESVYGRASAKSPLLEGELSGPVYLVSSSNKLPDLVADLHGQVNVQLHGVISTVKGGLKTVFEAPDAPVSKFTLNMDKGSKGLIINSKDLCKTPPKAKLNMKGQNGAQVKNNKFKLKTSCPKKKHKKK